MVLDDALGAVCWHLRAQHEAAKRLAVGSREDELGVIACEEVVGAHELGVHAEKRQAVLTHVLAEGEEHERRGHEALLAVDDEDFVRVLAARVDEHSDEVAALAACGAKHVAPQLVALPLVPRIDALVGRDDELHVRLSERIQEQFLRCLHGSTFSFASVVRSVGNLRTQPGACLRQIRAKRPKSYRLYDIARISAR